MERGRKEGNKVQGVEAEGKQTDVLIHAMASGGGRTRGMCGDCCKTWLSPLMAEPSLPKMKPRYTCYTVLELASCVASLGCMVHS